MPTTAADIALAVADALVTCVCAELEDRGDPPCFCGLVNGGQALPDSCGCSGGGCGRAWVRVADMFPSTRFPIQDQAAACDVSIGAVFEVGILRCVPTLGAAGSMPTALDLANATVQQLSDASALLTAIRCCTAVTDRQHVLGHYTPRDAGDCGGGVWTVTVQMTAAKVRS